MPRSRPIAWTRSGRTLGTRFDHKSAVMNWAALARREISTVEDLRLAAAHRELTDNHYLICRGIKATRNGGQKAIVLDFHDEDKVCRYQEATPGAGPTIDEARAFTTREQASQWGDLMDFLDGPRDGERECPELKALISGGVFLFDSAEAQPTLSGLAGSETPIPFLEKDAGAGTDAGRLTTAAGRLDVLDLDQLCASELREEFVFYRAGVGGGTTFVLCFGRDGLSDEADLARRDLLGRVARKGLTIPGIDPALISECARPRSDKRVLRQLVDTAKLLPVDLEGVGWTVTLRLFPAPSEGNARDEKPKLHERTARNLFLVPDRENGVLEFRKVCAAEISRWTADAWREGREGFKARRTLVDLAGIADGDGFGRRPFVLTTSGLTGLHQLLTDGERLSDAATISQKDPVEVLAIGEPGTGRFVSFDKRLPLVTVTTAVRRLAEVVAPTPQLAAHQALASHFGLTDRPEAAPERCEGFGFSRHAPENREMMSTTPKIQGWGLT